MSNLVNITTELRYNCYGYFGFGTGVEIVARTRQNYCSDGCKQGQLCWESHRKRVRELVPDLMEAMDQLLAEHNGDGPRAIMEYEDHFKCPPPDLQVLMGNIEDGGAVAQGGKPKNRGIATLPYPFHVV